MLSHLSSSVFQWKGIKVNFSTLTLYNEHEMSQRMSGN